MVKSHFVAPLLNEDGITPVQATYEIYKREAIMQMRWPHLMDKKRLVRNAKFLLEAKVPTINQLVRKGRKSKKVKSKPQRCFIR